MGHETNTLKTESEISHLGHFALIIAELPSDPPTVYANGSTYENPQLVESSTALPARRPAPATETDQLQKAA